MTASSRYQFPLNLDFQLSRCNLFIAIVSQKTIRQMDDFAPLNLNKCGSTRVRMWGAVYLVCPKYLYYVCTRVSVTLNLLIVFPPRSSVHPQGQVSQQQLPSSMVNIPPQATKYANIYKWSRMVNHFLSIHHKSQCHNGLVYLDHIDIYCVLQINPQLSCIDIDGQFYNK